MTNLRGSGVVDNSHDMLAGHVRFFPGSVGHLRNVREEPLVAGDDDTLAIGAGCVDLEGAEDGLDKEMVTRVVRYAKQENYKRVQAVGWCNIRAYAMWSESFPVSAYEAVGFHEVARVPYVHEAFECMLEGGHGPVVQKMVQADLDAGITKDEANTIHLVEIDTSRA